MQTSVLLFFITFLLELVKISQVRPYTRASISTTDFRLRLLRVIISFYLAADMKVYILLLMILLSMILEMECSPKKGRKYYGNRVRRNRRRYCHRRDCAVSNWSTWGHCDHNCGSTGVRSRSRRVVRPARCGGNPCPAPKEVEACNRKCSNGGIPQPGHCKCLPGFTGKCCEHGKNIFVYQFYDIEAR